MLHRLGCCWFIHDVPGGWFRTHFTCGPVKHPTRARVLLRMGIVTTPPKEGNMLGKLSAYAKTVVAAAGTLLMIWNEYSPGFADILPASWSHTITVVVGILTAIATFSVPNTTTSPSVAAGQSVILKSGRHERAE